MIIEKRGGAKILLSGWKPFEYCPLLECVPRQSISKLLVGVWVWGWVCKETWLLDWPTNAVGDCRASSKVSTNQRASWGRLFSSDMAAGRFCIGHCSFPPPTRHLFISSTALKKKNVFLDVSLFFLQLPWPLIPFFILSANTTLIEVDQILEITITWISTSYE